MTLPSLWTKYRILFTLAAVLIGATLVAGVGIYLGLKTVDTSTKSSEISNLTPQEDISEAPVETLVPPDSSPKNQLGKNLGGVDLQGKDLRGRNLSNADLGGANLRNANLSGVDLSSAKLGGANLEKANLINAKMSDRLHDENLRDYRHPKNRSKSFLPHSVIS